MAVDYTGPDGKTVTHLVRADGGGVFADELAGAKQGVWTIRALWQGDRENSSAVSEPVQLSADAAPPTEKVPPGFAVTSAVLTADSASVSGKCPLTVTFTGAITTNGPVVVTYTFARSDGATAPHQTLEFKGAETKAVSTSWTLGAADQLPFYEGWQSLQVLAPNQLESSPKAGAFAIKCDPG